jgi:hypothetical protein
MSVNITNSNSQIIATNFGNNLTFNELRFEPNSAYYVKISTRENSGRIYFSLFHGDFSTKDNPSVINTMVSYTSSIEYPGDVDYYTFTATEDGVWGYKVTGILNADISIICNDKDIKYSNPLYSYYGSANYTLTNSEFFAFKKGGNYTIKVKGSNIGTYSITKYYDIGMQTNELNSKSFSQSVLYSYPEYIDGYQGYQLGYFITKDKAKLFIDSLSGGALELIGQYSIGVIAGAASTNAVGFATTTLITLDNVERSLFIDYAKQRIDEMDSEGNYIAIRLEYGSVSRYQ